VFYGIPAGANYQVCGQNGEYTCQNEPWPVFFSKNLNRLGGGSETQTTATLVVHYASGSAGRSPYGARRSSHYALCMAYGHVGRALFR